MPPPVIIPYAACPVVGHVVEVVTATGVAAGRGVVLAVRGTFAKHRLLIHSGLPHVGKVWIDGDRCLLIHPNQGA